MAMRLLTLVAYAIQIYSAQAQTSQPLETPAPQNPAIPPTTNSQQPCGIIATAIANRGTRRSVAVDAEQAYACLQSVPIVQSDAWATVKNVINFAQYQSNLQWLKNPPPGYPNPGVDVMQGLMDIGERVNASQYINEYEFEADLQRLLASAYDGHLSFEGYTFGGAFAWLRPRTHSLISASLDGQTPQVFFTNDYNTTDLSYTPSPVAQINGLPVMDVLSAEAATAPYHDADTRWNSLFVLQSIESGGIFISPRVYPGPITAFTFENGTSTQTTNLAFVQDPERWTGVADGPTFYQTFVPYNPGQVTEKRDLPRAEPRHPSRLLPRKENIYNDFRPLLRDGSVPEEYPDPVIEHSGRDVTLGGFFVDTAIGRVAVLVLQTFFTEDVAATKEWQAVMSEFIAEVRAAGVERIVLDMRTNGGGKIFLGYEAFKQFFPEQEPYGASRYRMHEAANIMGSTISTLPLDTNTASVYTTPFNFHSFVDAEEAAFTSWTDMSGPVTIGTDQFTNTLRYNLSSELLIESEVSGLGISITGYGERANIIEQPFLTENIIMLTDGICASTCALFAEMMSHEAGVRSITIGGLPTTGPMQTVGGTKGSLVLAWDFFASLGQYVLDSFANTAQDYNRWQEIFPVSYGIQPADASINFQDSIRQGYEQVPTQFFTEYSSCRLWYTPTMFTNVSEVWVAAAEAMWGGADFSVDANRCVRDSVTEESLSGGADVAIGSQRQLNQTILPSNQTIPSNWTLPGNLTMPGNLTAPPNLAPSSTTGFGQAPQPTAPRSPPAATANAAAENMAPTFGGLITATLIAAFFW